MSSAWTMPTSSPIHGFRRPARNRIVQLSATHDHIETSAETSAETGTEAGAKPKAATRKPKADTAPDDLKRIKGIGPKLSEWLHENGVTRYAQIAEWDRAAIADYAERLCRMGGRIEADDWVGPAKLLAAGGEIEFSHRVEDGEVY